MQSERKWKKVSYTAVQSKANLRESFSQNQLTKESSVSQEPFCLSTLRIHKLRDEFQSAASRARGLKALWYKVFGVYSHDSSHLAVPLLSHSLCQRLQYCIA